MYLTELFDTTTPLQWHVHADNDQRVITASFEVDGDSFVVKFKKLYYNPVWDISFTKNNKLEMSKSKKSFMIMSIVVDAIKKFVDDYRPKLANISMSNSDPSRKKAYAAIMSRMAQTSNYDIITKSGFIYSWFSLSRNDGVDEVYIPIDSDESPEYDMAEYDMAEIDELLQALNETWHRNILVSSPSHDAVQDYYTFYSEELGRMIYQYKHSKEDRISWKIVPAAKLERIWSNAAKEGFVRDTKGLDKIADMFYTNIVKLNINTDIAEHNVMSKEEILDEYLDEDEMERFIDWCIDTDKGWRITDAGFPKLADLACLLHDSKTSEDKLLVCDAIMNVVHQRSDMASWFVEGGSETLSYISSPK